MANPKITVEKGTMKSIGEDELRRLLMSKGAGNDIHKKIPVPLEDIAATLGDNAVRYEEMPIAGFTRPTENGFLISINRNHNLERRRFTCAHEIAHQILNPGTTACRAPNRTVNSVERECERIASMLLLPNPAFRNYLLQDSIPSLKTVVKLAKIFVASVQSTAIRFVDQLKEIGEPSILIVSEMRAGKSGKKLRVRWSYQNTTNREGGRKYFIPPNKSLCLDSSVIAYRSGLYQAVAEDIELGTLRGHFVTESKGFGNQGYRYVLTLVFPSRNLS